MAAADNENAGAANSLDRFLTRAIIALVALIVGMVLGFTLAARTLTSEQVVEAAPPPPAATKQPEAPPVVAAKELEAPPVVEVVEVKEPETPPVVAADEAPEPAPALDPPALSGNFVIEIRELNGTARTKASVREVAQRGLHEIEACIGSHGAGMKVARLHYQQAVTPSGEVSGSLLLQGVNPELDACAERAIRSWSYGVASESSFFKLKLIWTA